MKKILMVLMLMGGFFVNAMAANSDEVMHKLMEENSKQFCDEHPSDCHSMDGILEQAKKAAQSVFIEGNTMHNRIYNKIKNGNDGQYEGLNWLGGEVESVAGKNSCPHYLNDGNRESSNFITSDKDGNALWKINCSNHVSYGVLILSDKERKASGVSTKVMKCSEMPDSIQKMGCNWESKFKSKKIWDTNG